MRTLNDVLLIGVATVVMSCATVPEPAAAQPEESPHAVAIRLVTSTQSDAIRTLDPGEWWHDVKSREWRARRPFYPGHFDSTHMFCVAYCIDGNVVQTWFVDTRKGAVQSGKPGEPTAKE